MADNKGLDMIQPYKQNLLQLCELRRLSNLQRNPTYGVVKISEDVFNLISSIMQKNAKNAWMLLGGSRDEKAFMIVNIMSWKNPPSKKVIKQLMKGFEFKIASEIKNIKEANFIVSTFNHK